MPQNMPPIKPHTLAVDLVNQWQVAHITQENVARAIQQVLDEWERTQAELTAAKAKIKALEEQMATGAMTGAKKPNLKAVGEEKDHG